MSSYARSLRRAGGGGAVMVNVGGRLPNGRWSGEVAESEEVLELEVTSEEAKSCPPFVKY